MRGAWVVVQGPLVESAPDYKPALESCFRLLGLARTFNRKGLITDSDFGPFALLLSALDGNAVPGFVHKTVGAIKAYDEKNGTALLETAARASSTAAAATSRPRRRSRSMSRRCATASAG